MHRLWLRVAPLGVEESVVTHQAHFRVRASLAQFARGFNREQHRFRLGLVGAELFVGELDRPLVIALDEKVSGWPNAGPTVCAVSPMGRQHADEGKDYRRKPGKVRRSPYRGRAGP